MFCLTTKNYVLFIHNQYISNDPSNFLLYDWLIPEDILTNHIIVNFCCLLVLLPLGILFLVPTLILWAVHVKNAWADATTSERFGRKFRKKK